VVLSLWLCIRIQDVFCSVVVVVVDQYEAIFGGPREDRR